jgi:hypothetical protein
MSTARTCRSRQSSTSWWVVAALSAGALILSACSIAPVPQAALADVDARAFRKLRTEDLGAFVSSFDGPVELVVGEARLRDGSLERRAYVTFRGSAPIYLGALGYQLADAPIETLHIDMAGDRFMIAWVDASVAGKPVSVTLGRSRLQPVDDSINTLRVAAAVNGVAILPIAAVEAHLWQSVTEVRVETATGGFAWQKQYEPPIPIEHLFQSVSVP